MRIAADSHYAVYVNGEYVYASQYADYDFERVYDEIDISAYVRSGENELLVKAYCALTDSSVYRRGNPYIAFEVAQGERILAYSNEKTLCAPDNNYVSGETDFITMQMGYTFSYDATRPLLQYKYASPTDMPAKFSRRPIKQCVMGERKPSKLIAKGAYIERRDRARSVGERMSDAFMARCDESDMPDNADGQYFIYDLGENDTGLLDVGFYVSEPCEALIGWGEHLDDMRVRAHVGGRNFCAMYKAQAGENRFFHPFRRIGARYIQINIASRNAQISYAGLRPVTYPVPEGAGIDMRDGLHQRIYSACRRTLLLCMHEHYEDCPWREQALYAMDSRNQILAGYYVFGEYEFARASLDLLAKSIRADGLLELCAPARVSVDIPSFSYMFAVALWEYLLHSKDSAFARETLPVAKTIVETALSRRNADGLVPRYAGKGMWNFYEWTDGLDGHLGDGFDADESRVDAPLNAFLILAVSALKNIHDALGDRAEALRLDNIANDMRKSLNRVFFDDERHIYYSYAQNGGRYGEYELTQALCVYARACPDEYLKQALRRLTDGSLTEVTLAYSIFKYEALLLSADEFGEYVARDIEKLWGGMLLKGATTFWETIKGGDDFDGAGSLCHGWSAVPAYLYFAYCAPSNHVRGMPEALSARVRLPDGTIQQI